MFKSHLAIAAVAASALLIGSQAFAQQKQAAPAGQTTAQAGQAESCGGALDKANNNIALRIQGDGQISRETARVHLYKAGQYLAAGNEAQCWQELGISKQIVR